MSGRRIDDHAFWAGRPGKDTVFPEGPYKTKKEQTADSAGHVGAEYPDTTEGIRRDQERSERTVGKHEIRPGYRN